NSCEEHRMRGRSAFARTESRTDAPLRSFGNAPAIGTGVEGIGWFRHGTDPTSDLYHGNAAKRFDFSAGTPGAGCGKSGAAGLGSDVSTSRRCEMAHVARGDAALVVPANSTRSGLSPSGSCRHTPRMCCDPQLRD